MGFMIVVNFMDNSQKYRIHINSLLYNKNNLLGELMTNLPIYRKSLTESLKVSQEMINFLINHSDSNGIIKISQSEVARRLNYSQTRISQLYSRLGYSDPCIVKLRFGVYQIRYTDIKDRGLYTLLLKCIEKIERDESGIIDQSSDYHSMNTKLKAAYLGITIDEVKILDGFINTVFIGSPRGKVYRYVSKKL